MKKYGKYFAILSILVALSFAGCTAISSSGSLNEETKTAEQKNGNVTVKMFIPDYKALAENTAIAQSRAIAPQTKYARMKVKRPFTLGGGYFGNDVTIAIKDEDLTNVENAGGIGIPGKIWKAQFAVPAGTYSAGDIIVELIDSEKDLLNLSKIHPFVQSPKEILDFDYSEMNEKLYVFLDKLTQDYLQNKNH